MRSIKVRLVLFIVLSLILVVAIMTGFSIYTNNILNDALDDFTNISVEATTTVLNGDRDFYQALTSLQVLSTLDLNSDEFKGEIEGYEENAQQTPDRVNGAVDLINWFAYYTYIGSN